MSAIEFDDFTDELLKDKYLATLDDETRQEVVEHLNSRLFKHASPQDLFGLVLVLLGLRPACIISATRFALSATVAEEASKDHEALVTCDIVGQFLDTYEIPYVLTTHWSAGRPNRPAEIYLNYHVSFDDQRLESYTDQRLDDPHTESGLVRSEEEALGRLLDYPEAAIQAYCDRDHLSIGYLFDSLSDEELREELGVAVQLFDAFDVDHRAFTTYALPYVVPETAPTCLSRVERDLFRYFLGGILADERYGITLFRQVLADYRTRFAPDA